MPIRSFHSPCGHPATSIVPSHFVRLHSTPGSRCLICLGTTFIRGGSTLPCWCSTRSTSLSLRSTSFHSVQLRFTPSSLRFHCVPFRYASLHFIQLRSTSANRLNFFMLVALHLKNIGFNLPHIELLALTLTIGGVLHQSVTPHAGIHPKGHLVFLFFFSTHSTFQSVSSRPGWQGWTFPCSQVWGWVLGRLF